VKALVGLGLPISAYDFGFLLENDIPSLFIIGTRDEFCPDQEMKLLAARLPPTSSVRWMEGADHFFTRQIDQVQTLVRNFLQARFEESPT
jgi:alpha/beta superfamily hydrolase